MKTGTDVISGQAQIVSEPRGETVSIEDLLLWVMSPFDVFSIKRQFYPAHSVLVCYKKVLDDAIKSAPSKYASASCFIWSD